MNYRTINLTVQLDEMEIRAQTAEDHITVLHHLLIRAVKATFCDGVDVGPVIEALEYAQAALGKPVGGFWSEDVVVTTNQCTAELVSKTRRVFKEEG